MMPMPPPLLQHLYKDLKKICQYLFTILLLHTADQTNAKNAFKEKLSTPKYCFSIIIYYAFHFQVFSKINAIVF